MNNQGITDSMELETPLNPEVSGGRPVPFTAEAGGEVDKIREQVTIIYNNRANPESDEAKKAWGELEIIGCDLTRAHDLYPALNEQEFGDLIITPGKKVITGKTYETGDGRLYGGEINDDKLLITVLLEKGITPDVKINGATLRLRPEPSSPTGLVIEIFSEGGALSETKPLVEGENVLKRPENNDVTIRTANITKSSVTLEIFQRGTSLKEMNR